jgi:hypothetical protein
MSFLDEVLLTFDKLPLASASGLEIEEEKWL